MKMPKQEIEQMLQKANSKGYLVLPCTSGQMNNEKKERKRLKVHVVPQEAFWWEKGMTLGGKSTSSAGKTGGAPVPVKTEKTEKA